MNERLSPLTVTSRNNNISPQQYLATTITLPDLAKPQHQQQNQQISLL